MKFNLTHTESKFCLDNIEADSLFTDVNNKITWIADYGLGKLTIGLENKPERIGVGLTCDRKLSCLYINPSDHLICCCGIKIVHVKREE